jgi:nitrate/nitrite transporter NarK
MRTRCSQALGRRLRGVLGARARTCGYRAPVMLSMFVLWLVVFAGIVLRWRWTPGLVIVTLIWTAVLLKLHMNDAIPLNF